MDKNECMIFKGPGLLTAPTTDEIFVEIVGRIGMLEVATFGSAALAEND